MTDCELARRLGVSHSAVYYRRRLLEIPACRKWSLRTRKKNTRCVAAARMKRIVAQIIRQYGRRMPGLTTLVAQRLCISPEWARRLVHALLEAQR